MFSSLKGTLSTKDGVKYQIDAFPRRVEPFMISA